ncbi:MAG: tetraacyldisaccharide 4'-kinase, partial [Rhodospirillales bacterium]|nr:tetraacyldisaccharide 4'-kinase [Rhodospirillales bacterium]
MSGEATGLLAAAARGGLALAEPVYRAVVSARNKRFDNGKRTIARLPRPVISVGNITTGGTGKTPMVIHLARLLHEAGHRPAVLLRGYKADPEHPQASDEAAELTAALDGIAYVEANPNRVESARRVLDNHPNADVFLLDDGFQHRQVHRDLDMVLIDAMCPFGHDHLLPRGLLREPMKNLARADAVVVTRADQVEPGKLKEIDQRIVAMHGKPPIAHAA